MVIGDFRAGGRSGGDRGRGGIGGVGLGVDGHPQLVEFFPSVPHDRFAGVGRGCVAPFVADYRCEGLIRCLQGRL